MDSRNLLNEIEAVLRSYWQKRNDAFLDEIEFDRSQSMFGPSAIAVRLNQNNASPSYPSPTTNASLSPESTVPESVLDSLGFYDRACPEVAREVLQFPLQNGNLWIVSAGNLDEGWLEVFDEQGNFLSAGRRYVELVSWGSKEEQRTFTKTLGFPKDMDDRKARSIWKSRR